MLALLVAWLTFAVAGTSDLPMTDRPRTLQADDLDRFYVDYGDRVIRWTTERDRVFNYKPDEKGWSTQSIRHLVSPPDGTIHTVQKIAKKECHDKECSSYTNYYKYRWVQCAQGGRCTDTNLGSWSVAKGAKYPNSYSAEHKVTEQGTALIHVAKTIRNSEGSRTVHTYTCGGSECKAKQYEEQWFDEMKVPPTYRIDEKKKDFYGGALGEGSGKVTLAKGLMDAMANVDTNFVYDRAGRPHIYLHSSNRKFAHKYVDDSGDIIDKKARLVVDGPESGASNAVVRYGPQGVLTFHYFYKNSYYKGVRATFFDDAEGSPVWQVDVVNGRDDNPGWQLLAAATPQGRVMVSWLDEPIGKKNRTTTIRLFDNAQSVFDAQVPQPDDWTRNYKIWFGRVGAGPGLALWNFTSGGPSNEDFTGVDPRFRMDSSYSAPPSIMIGGTVEAKFGGFSLGASYARNQLQDAASNLSETTDNPVYERIFGQLGIDKIIKYHDIRLALRIGLVDLNYDIVPRGPQGTTGTGVEPSRQARGHRRSLYRRLDIYFLNTWRVRYGFFNQSYEAVLPFYVWAIDAGDTSYRFVDSFQSGATFNDYGITVGYSRIDYATKFENKVTAPFVDADAGFGISTARLDVPVTVAEGDPIDSATAIMVPFNVEVGGVILRRSHKLRGLGWYTRVFYRTEGSWAGTSAKPGDKDEAVDEDRITVGYDRLEIRHGPYLDVGLVF